MRIVVTGATGNVGSRLVPQLLDHPDVGSVVGLARRLPAEPDARAEWHAVDVAQDDLTALVRGADVVVHLAWLLQPAHHPDEMRRVNVIGTQRVLDAVAAAGVPALVHASSIGAYSPGPADAARRVAEDHPTHGISTSTYSRHKACAERMLDAFEQEHPERRVVRLRPGVVLQAEAASELARYFFGAFVPQSLVRASLLPVVPAVDRLAFQVVHASDMAAAYVLACVQPVTGAFNIATEPVLDPPTLAAVLGARQVPLPAPVLRALVDLTWRLHLQPTDPGWVDIGRLTPLLDTRRARTVLGWTPRYDAAEAVLETLEAIGAGRGGASPVLRPRARGVARVLEAVRALVPGAPGTG
ncbi:MAG: NAD-dependent epimerase/dehydratase family protein [Frankiales bacterium]|jgi:UDP-glucose 4-epimerase|nr:NAD-dependent epimerase/dehydratase family protein [Frankiales bacterium]